MSSRMASRSRDRWDRIEPEFKIKSNLNSFALVDRRLARFWKTNRFQKAESDLALSVSTASTAAETTTTSSPSSSCSTPTSSGFFSSKGKRGDGQTSPSNYDDDEIMQRRKQADAQDLAAALFDVSIDEMESRRLQMRINASASDDSRGEGKPPTIEELSDTLQMQLGLPCDSPHDLTYAEQIDSHQLGKVKNLLKAKIRIDKSDGDRCVAVAALEKELLLWPKTLNQLSEGEVSKLKLSLVEIEEALQTSQQKSTILEIDNQTMSTEIAALSTLCAMLSAEKGELNKSLKCLQDSHEELEEEIISLIEDVETKVAEIDILSELSSVERRDLQIRLRAIEDDNSVMERSFNEHDEETDRRETHIRDLEAEVESLKHRIVHVEAERQQVKQDTLKLSTEVETLSSLASNRLSKEEGAQALIRALVNEMREGTDLFKTEIDACKAMLADLQEKNVEAEAERSKVAAAFESMSSLATSRLVEKEEAEACLVSLKTALAEQNELHETDLTAHRKKLESLELMHNERMEQQNENHKIDLKRRNKDVESLKENNVREIQEQKELYDIQLESHREEINSLKNLHNRMMEEQTEHYHNDLKARCKENELLNNTNIQMKADSEMHTAETKFIKVMNGQLKADNEALAGENELLKKMKNGVKADNNTLIAENEILKDTNSRVEANNKRLAAEIENMSLRRSVVKKDDVSALEDSTSLREAARRLRELSELESSKSRRVKGVRAPDKTNQKGFAHTYKTQEGNQLEHALRFISTQQFLVLGLLWSLTILLCRLLM